MSPTPHGTAFPPRPLSPPASTACGRSLYAEVEEVNCRRIITYDLRMNHNEIKQKNRYSGVEEEGRGYRSWSKGRGQERHGRQQGLRRAEGEGTPHAPLERPLRVRVRRILLPGASRSLPPWFPFGAPEQALFVNIITSFSWNFQPAAEGNPIKNNFSNIIGISYGCPVC